MSAINKVLAKGQFTATPEQGEKIGCLTTGHLAVSNLGNSAPISIEKSSKGKALIGECIRSQVSRRHYAKGLRRRLTLVD